MSHQIFLPKKIFKVVYLVGCIVFIAWLSMLSISNNLQSDYRIYEAAYIGIPILGLILAKVWSWAGVCLQWL